MTPMTHLTHVWKFVLLTAAILFACYPCIAQTTQFTYQGKLNDNGAAANGSYDFQFKLFDSVAQGGQQGTTQTVSGLTVASGVFTAQLDFGACATCLNGSVRFLEI